MKVAERSYSGPVRAWRTPPARQRRHIHVVHLDDDADRHLPEGAKGCLDLGRHLPKENLNRDGRREAMHLPIVLAALVAVSSIIAADRLHGPMFHDLAYCLNDGGAQITRMCTGRVPPD